METVSRLPPLDEPGLEKNIQEPMSKSDVEYEKAVLDAKCKALGVLCTLQSSGKGDDKTRNLIQVLGSQIAKL